jgi:peptidoglycan LD-endopeptidase CwlK
MGFLIFMNLIIILFCLILYFQSDTGNKTDKKEHLIIDSQITLSEALKGRDFPEANTKNLRIIDVEYYSFDRKLHKGQILIHKDLANDIKEIFQIIKEKKFPIKKVLPINNYNWSDQASMKDNNTSAFNYRVVAGTKTFSAHAMGRAIDINPLLNPEIKNGKISPEGAQYNKFIPGTITSHSWLIHEFYKRGWRWGGDWKFMKDYQHFEKAKSK